MGVIRIHRQISRPDMLLVAVQARQWSPRDFSAINNLRIQEAGTDRDFYETVPIDYQHTEFFGSGTPVAGTCWTYCSFPVPLGLRSLIL